uniref:Receptor expression-enhancing protein n=1 Tax=Caenorhabditis japonica TaxID=281687 RepID=A0A8R1DHR4_CAEJA
MSFLARGLSNLIGLVVPILQAFKILKKPTNKKLTQSVHYWSVYGSFLIIDWFLTTFFITCFIPFYDFFVLVFTIGMAVPQLGVAPMLYTKFLAPALRKYERRIDRGSAIISNKAWENMPVMANMASSVLASACEALMAPPVLETTLEIDEIDISTEICRSERKSSKAAKIQAPVRCFEIQDDDDVEVFEPFPTTAVVKQEEPDSDENLDVVKEIRPIRRPVTRKYATRSQSVH